MKNVILGLFDDRTDARRVLEQLAGSPLDLSAIQVLHGDGEVQREMAAAAGLRPPHTVPLGAVTGAFLGGALGWATGSGLLSDGITLLGPLLTMVAGAAVGAVVGIVMGALSEPVRLPTEHAAEIAGAIDDGATVVLVRTDNLPTARAIRDLFQAAGSRTFAPLEALDPGAPPADGVSEVNPADPDAQSVPDDHLPFTPPGRRDVPAADLPDTTEPPAPPAQDPTP